MGRSSREPLYSDRLDQALAFVTTTFRHVTRKDGVTPYLWHLLEVGAMVGDAGGDEDQVIAGLLHDYLEDIEGGSPEILVSRFGRRVAEMVRALSDTTERPKPPWRARKREHVAAMRDAAPQVKLIAVCDKLHNARATLRDLRRYGDSVWERFNAPKTDTLWYYRSMHAALAANGYEHALLGELEDLVAELHAVGGVELSRA